MVPQGAVLGVMVEAGRGDPGQVEAGRGESGQGREDPIRP